MNREALIVEPKDNVIVALEPMAIGDVAVYPVGGEKKTVAVVTDVPIYHKVAIRDIKKGEHIIKYGEKIGVAIADIKMGEHVHVQNLDSEREDMQETTVS